MANAKGTSYCQANILLLFGQLPLAQRLTGNLLGPADHVNQLLISQRRQGHHDVCLSHRPLHLLHEVGLRRLRLQYSLDQLLWSQLMGAVRVEGCRPPWPGQPAGPAGSALRGLVAPPSSHLGVPGAAALFPHP